jgi:DDE superfamily endonuclease
MTISRNVFHALQSRLGIGVAIGLFYRSHRKATQRNIARFLTSPKRERIANKLRLRDHAMDNFDLLTDVEFKRSFRLDRPAFDDLLLKIEPALAKNEEFARRNVKDKKGQPITAKHMLMATLRWLAGGMYIDICMSLLIAFGSFYGGVLWPTMHAIDECPELQIGLPLNDPEAMRKIAEEFAAIAPAAADEMYGVITALDGWVCETRKPTKEEVGPNIRNWRNRKGLWGFTVLGGCDARCKFTVWSCQSAGSANDILAWRYAFINREVVQKGRLPQQYFFIGDEGLGCEDQLLTPWSGRGIGKDKDAFNFHLSVRRQVIERAFGILVRRWGVLNRKLVVSFHRWNLVVTVCAKLHNVCVDRNIPEVPRHRRDVRPGDSPNVFFNVQPTDDLYRYSATDHRGERRRRITERLAAQRIERPAHAARNSRA